MPPTNRGKDRNPTERQYQAEQERKRGFTAKQTKGAADWGSCDPEKLQAAVVAAGNIGGALRFGYTSDGGAYSIGIYGDGDPYTHYVRPDEDIDGTLRDLAEYFEALRT